ncbi:hypothetical protein E4U21_000184 [Claviceps maximensis]|nr:hypothetical protein E4U21_000184 [Claviceps maximensis]
MPSHNHLASIIAVLSLLASVAHADPSEQHKSSDGLFRREQAAGSRCAPEGQWNCMTNSFQRCASGQWSVVMNCAAGTACSPVGLSVEFRIQHDGSVDGSGSRRISYVLSLSAGQEVV